MNGIDEKKQFESRKRLLNSLDEKRRLTEERQRLISESLKNGHKRGRIVFDSDDQDEKSTVKKIKTEKSQLTLFNDEDDEPNLEEIDPEKLVKPNRFTGTFAEKLQKMEMHFGGDERFRMDQRFMEEEYEQKKEDSLDPEALEHLYEKKKEFNILSRVLGKEIEGFIDHQSKKPLALRPFLRFDPDNPEHIKWMQENKNDQGLKKSNSKTVLDKNIDSDSSLNEEYDLQAKKLKRRVAHSQSDKSEKKVKEMFFEIQPEFAQELKKKMINKDSSEGTKTPQTNGSSKEFSFLAAMGRETPKISESTNTTETIEKPTGKMDLKRLSILKNSNDTISTAGLSLHEDNTKWLKEIIDTCKLSPEQKIHRIFNIKVNDPSIAGYVSSFRAPALKNHLMTNWDKKREQFIKNYQRLAKLSDKNEKEKQRKSRLTLNIKKKLP